jgi:hypothetical protein
MAKLELSATIRMAQPSSRVSSAEGTAVEELPDRAASENVSGALAVSRTAIDGIRPENQVRTGLPAGGRWIRTLGPPATASFVVGPPTARCCEGQAAAKSALRFSPIFSARQAIRTQPGAIVGKSTPGCLVHCDTSGSSGSREGQTCIKGGWANRTPGAQCPKIRHARMSVHELAS